ncbi:MAG: hypothetical protein FWE25_11190 [Lachnospiraceae bacterium]|nr:hypothetical protein [Lachnospiraceae bacterium]
MEKIYKLMHNSGIANVSMGIILIVVGVTVGIMTIVNGTRLLMNKKEITF